MGKFSRISNKGDYHHCRDLRAACMIFISGADLSSHVWTISWNHSKIKAHKFGEKDRFIYARFIQIHIGMNDEPFASQPDLFSL